MGQCGQYGQYMDNMELNITVVMYKFSISYLNPYD